MSTIDAIGDAVRKAAHNGVYRRWIAGEGNSSVVQLEAGSLQYAMDSIGNSVQGTTTCMCVGRGKLEVERCKSD